VRQQPVDHIGELAAAAIHAALPGRGAAHGKGTLGQFIYLLPVAEGIKLGSQVVYQPFDE